MDYIPSEIHQNHFIQIQNDEFINIDQCTFIDIYEHNGYWWIRFHKKILYKHYNKPFDTREEALQHLENLLKYK